MNEKVISNIHEATSIKDIKTALYEPYYDMPCKPKCGKMLKIALLNASCGGLGDIIFAQKLKKYLQDWYSAKVIIYTTNAAGHIKLGEKMKNLVQTTNIKSECKTFASLKFPKTNEKFDLYFISPLISNFSPSIVGISKTFKYANYSNIYIFRVQHVGKKY
jgi:hypothetical protein